MVDNRFTRRDWLTGAASTLLAGGLHACGPTAPPFTPPPAPDPPFVDEPAPDRPNIIVFLADTLRADHLSCYGNPVKASPFLDGLARLGVQFEHNTSGSTWTKPSLGTMLTGVPARVHQAVGSSPWKGIADLSTYRVQALRSAFQTLPEALKSVGYSTAYLQTNAHGRPEFGYGRGFDFVQFLPHYPAFMQVNDALDWITKEAHQPFFLFIHEINPHGPYEPDISSFLELHGVMSHSVLSSLDPNEAEIVDRFSRMLGTGPEIRTSVEGISPEANRYIKMNYDAEIYEVDKQIERLVLRLDEFGILKHTVFAFTSDHGEGFGDHGFYAHVANLAYDELIRVPLIMAGGGLPGNVRVPHTTTMIDFYPTLLELAGAPIPPYVPGTPMFSRSGELIVTNDRLTYTDLDKTSPDVSKWDTAIIKGRYKVASHKKGQAHWIFDRETDPGEHENLVGTGRLPKKLEQDLIDSLRAEVDRYDQLSRQFGEPVWMEADDSVEEELNALGYV